MTALDLVIDLGRARRRLAAPVDEALSVHHGLALGDLALLLELVGAPEHRLRRTDLARRLGITPSGVARQVAPLERMGLVGRESARDARLALVTLTETGAHVVENARRTAEEAAEAALDGLSDPRTREQLAALLRGIA